MTDHIDFEIKLEGSLRSRAALASRPFDAEAIAHTAIITAASRNSRSGRPDLRWLRPASMRWIVVAATILLIAALVAAAVIGARLRTPPSRPIQGVFVPIGSSGTPSSSYDTTATLLQSGLVLIVGRHDDVPPARHLLLDPTTGTFTRTGPMVAYRTGHAAALLDDGHVLLVGGAAETVAHTAELFDPSSKTFSATGTPVYGGAFPVAVKLRDGRVLVIGGTTNGATTAAEIYDPGHGTFTATGSTSRPRGAPTATLLADGTVLVAGGDGIDSPDDTAEIYDPTTGTFAATGHMTVPRQGFTATRLSDGRVLFVGGYTSTTGPGGGIVLATSGDIYDPSRRTFSPTGPMTTPRWMHAAALLRDGRVLVAGGTASPGGSATVWSPDGIANAEIFDPASGTFGPTGTMTVPRMNLVALTLADGDVLLMGHASPAPNGAQSEAATSAEVFR